ncbi:MAG: hypothetical protein LBL79_15060 [Prevotella sp.]|jgi:hypothetical protein|nr:hypothetical protein [Prevotella sp.]
MTKEEFWFEAPLLIRVMVRMGYGCAYLYAVISLTSTVVLRLNSAEIIGTNEVVERYPILIIVVILIFIFLAFAFGVFGYLIQKKKSSVAAVISFCLSLFFYKHAIYNFLSVIAFIGMIGTIWFNKEFSMT